MSKTTLIGIWLIEGLMVTVLSLAAFNFNNITLVVLFTAQWALSLPGWLVTDPPEGKRLTTFGRVVEFIGLWWAMAAFYIGVGLRSAVRRSGQTRTGVAEYLKRLVWRNGR